MPATLRDIAQECGVDVSTVSRALRGDKRIREDTVSRIRGVARELGYRANPAAQALAGAKTNVIWLILSEMGNVLEQEIAEAASRYLESQGYDLAVVLCHFSAERYSYLLKRLRSNPVDGALIVPPFSPEAPAVSREIGELTAAGFPLVFVDRYPEDTARSVVTTSNRAAGARLVGALAGEGADHIVVLDTHEANVVQKERCEGYLARAEKAGISCSLDWSGESCEGKTRLGLVGSSWGVVEKWRRQNQLAVSGKVLLAGTFDSWNRDRSNYECIYVCRQDFGSMAERAVNELIGQLRGDTAPGGRIEVELKACERLG